MLNDNSCNHPVSERLLLPTETQAATFNWKQQKKREKEELLLILASSNLFISTCFWNDPAYQKKMQQILTFSKHSSCLNSYTEMFFGYTLSHVISKYFRKRLDNIPTTVPAIHAAFTVYD